MRSAIVAGGSVIIVGPAGIGKSAVLRAALDGVSVRAGCALPSLRRHAYLPLQAAVGQELAGDPEEVAALVAAELGDAVLAVEDLQWADSATVAAVSTLAAVARMAVTSREEPAAGVDGLWSFVLRLDPLRPRDASALARRLHPGLDADARSSLVDAAQGNPLLLERLPTASDSMPSLVEAVAARLADLPDGARELLSLLGRPGLQPRPRSGGPTSVHRRRGPVRAWCRPALRATAGLGGPARDGGSGGRDGGRPRARLRGD